MDEPTDEPLNLPAAQPDAEAISNVRRQLESFVLYEMATEENLEIARQAEQLTQDLPDPPVNADTETDNSRWYSLASSLSSSTVTYQFDMETSGGWGSTSGYSGGLTFTGESTKKEVTDEQLADARTHLSELHAKLQQIRISVIQTRMSRLNTIILETTAEVESNARGAFEALEERETTHAEFMRYMEYLAAEMANIHTNASERLARENTEKNRNFNRKKANIPDTRSWMFCPIGIEYTFHPVYYCKKGKEEVAPWNLRVTSRYTRRSGEPQALIETPNARRIVDRINNRINMVQNATGLDGEARAYVDNGVVEVCSPVHKNWKSMVNWYRWMIGVLGSSVTVTSRKRGTGGGHMNCSIPKKDGMMFMYNLMIDIGNRPYINWIFNDPSDNHTANCMWDSKDMQRMYNWMERGQESEARPSTRIECIPDPHVDKEPDTKDKKLKSLVLGLDSRGFAIRVKSETHYEFRCFDAVRNERDLKDTVTFISAYCRYIYAITLRGERLDTCGGNTSDLHRFARFARRDFNKLLRKIGLEPKDYKRFIDRNFETRRKLYGKKYLV